MTKKFIQQAIKPSHKGKLRAKLHVKAGEDIPEAKLAKAEKSKSPTLRKEAALASTLKTLNKKK